MHFDVIPRGALTVVLVLSSGHGHVEASRAHDRPEIDAIGPGQPPRQVFVGGPIIDEGYPSFRQLADVNGDGVRDYCRLVGDTPNIYLSCQLGMPNGGYASEPYGFNSIKGIDAGFAPAALVDINEDKRADFCRYVGDGATVRLACTLAGNAGFAQDPYVDPSRYLPTGYKRTLVTASDGTPISYVSNATTGRWYAYGTDAAGRRLRLEGENQKIIPRYVPPGGASEVYSSGTRLYDETPPSAPLPPHVRVQPPHIILQTSVTFTSTGALTFRISGAHGRWSSTFGSGLPDTPAFSAGFGYFQTEFSRSVGYRTAHLRVWRCQKPETLCESNFSGKVDANASSPRWDGTSPQALAQYVPEEVEAMTYFRPLIDMKTAEADVLVRTGIDWFDAKHWYEHTSSDWGTVESSLTDDAKSRIKRVQLIADLGKWTGGVFGAVVGGGVPGALVGGFIGNVVFGWTSREVIDIIVERDEALCRPVTHYPSLIT